MGCFICCFRCCSPPSGVSVQQWRGVSALKLSQSVSEFEVKNEPMFGYLTGSPERQKLESALNKWKDVTTDIPIVIGGKEYRTDNVRTHTAVSLNPSDSTRMFISDNEHAFMFDADIHSLNVISTAF